MTMNPFAQQQTGLFGRSASSRLRLLAPTTFYARRA
jgi:hypothetical protein